MTCTKFTMEPGVSGIVCTDPTVGPLRIEHGSQAWWFEWSDRWGPLRVRKNGASAEQPGWRSSFWTVTCIWAAQGKRSDGSNAVWSEPPAAVHYYKIRGRQRLITEIVAPDGYLDGLSRVEYREAHDPYDSHSR